jgi:hypothetical protein
MRDPPRGMLRQSRNNVPPFEMCSWNASSRIAR